MKKVIAVLLAAVLAAGSFSACSNDVRSDSDKIQIVTTIFPEYDWVMNALADAEFEK